MPAQARKDLIREGEVGVYHTWSRCVQRIWLCGEDPLTGIDYSYRKVWIEKLIEYMSRVFAIDVANYHILDNHAHVIPCTRPDVAEIWTPEEVAWRWKMAWPEWTDGEWVREPEDAEIEALLRRGPEAIEKIRANLSSLSWFTARWKEPIARLVNKEAGTSGHMWAERFGCRELRDDAERLTGMLYTDMQQVQHGAVENLIDSSYSSIQLRLRTWAAEEAAGMLEAFHGSKTKNSPYDMPGELVEELLLDSWLTPFSDQSPMPLMRRETAEDIEAAPVLDLSSTSTQDSTQAMDKSAEQDPAGQKPTQKSDHEAEEKLSSMTIGVKRPTTFEVHEFYFPRIDDRIRRPILEISRESYFKILERTAQEWLETCATDQLIHPTMPPRAAPTATPFRWQKSVKGFNKFMDKLAETIPIPILSQDSRGHP